MSEDIMGEGVDNLQTLPIPGSLNPLKLVDFTVALSPSCPEQ